MPAPDNDTAALASVRAEVARRLAERAADPVATLPELRELHERLRLIDAGLSARPALPPHRRWPPGLWAALAVAAIVSVAAAVPVRSVPFSLEVQAHTVSLQFDMAAEIESQPVDTELRIEGQTQLVSPVATLAKDAAESGANLLVLRAPHLTLRRVTHPAGSFLIVRAGPQVQLTFDAPRPALGVEVEFSGVTSWRVGDAVESAPVAFEHAEWVRASAGDAAQPNRRPPPLDLWLGRIAGKTYAWSDLRPGALQFVERRAGDSGGGDAVVASSLEQAHLTLPATGNDVKLGAGDHLEIGGLVLERFELTAGDSVGIKLSGTARTLATRTGDFERSLKPSFLEFVARHHTVSLFWSAALLLWGAITWVRKQFDSAPG
ncbi:hypothetical protein QTI66_38640 [Variovorax sp. J22R133]|uniref:hypothetical protein n=1 Tax=Variovorax brevis TaxID=3053503 RepID=UPI00257569EF|nr:hypothetical protein [Variovorax sp. J22R133]MDM0118005.1 hypothetical protein [Variovorax sp. J22R133]